MESPRQDETYGDSDFKVGDLVRMRPGTLAWSGEPMLRKLVGEVVSAYHDEGGKPRVTVRFPVRRLLARREAGVFVLVERSCLEAGNTAA